MSKAEPRLPPPPRLAGAIREAAIDLYYNSWRFLPANLLFGIVLIALLLVASSTPWGLLITTALVPPAAGCMRMATTLVRDGHTDFGEFLAVLRKPWQVMAIGCAQLFAGLVLVVDLMIGASLASPVGTLLTISAVYALAIGWALAVLAWPILLDPIRRDQPVPARLRLAGLLLVAHPLRMGGMALLIGALLVLSTIAVAAIVTVALAYAFLVVARYVLPAADRLEGRATVEPEA